MAVRRRGGSWQIDVSVTFDGQAVRRKQAFKGTIEGALAHEAAVREALLAGVSPPVPTTYRRRQGPTLRRALNASFERRWQGKPRELSARSYIKKLEDHFGPNTLMKDIFTEEIDRYILELTNRGLAPQTVRHHLNPLSAAFTDIIATSEGRHLVRPAFRYPPLGDNTRTRILTDWERREIVRLFWEEFDIRLRRGKPEGIPDGIDWADLFVFLMDTGVRQSEARRLRARDLRGDRVYVWKTKNNRPRMIPLTARALEAYQRQESRRPPNLEAPFGWATNDRISWAWRWVRDAMGMTNDPEFIPYVLRHDCASRLYRETRDLMLVREWMGHRSFQMTLRYARLDPVHLDKARDLLEATNDQQP